MTDPRSGRIRCMVDASAAELHGYEQIEWDWLRAGWIADARSAGMERTSLASPAQPWLDWLAEVDQLAVMNVVLDNPEALADLLGFVAEPAMRLGIDVIIVADIALGDLQEDAFVEPEFRYAHALQRLRWLMGSPQPRRVRAAELPDTPVELDQAQQKAVCAGSGVIQVIAPAGSGKTAVLVERVRELRRRGIPGNAIACVTFNRAAKEELTRRLTDGHVGDVAALTFHGLGRMILLKAKALRKLGDPTLAQWRQLAFGAKQAAGRDGVWLDPGEARALLSEVKLGRLQSPEEYAATLTETSDGESRTLAALYMAYAELQREDGKMDFDDLILGALQLLRQQPQLRESWQQRWQCLLVDEYQDIEPAQELLVRILAAPHDQLFCVGDEDQTLYAFRRASVARIIRLDEHYPALDRVALTVNYRCPGKVVVASDRLIALNRVRFPKRIAPAPGREDDDTITLRAVTRQIDAATAVAQTLASRQRGDIVVLARTTNALRPVALACADQQVRIDGPPKLFTPTGARLALQRHLQLALAPERADPALVRAVCRTPGRSLKQGAEQAIAARLRDYDGFAAAFDGVAAPRRRGGKLLAPGELFTALPACGDARDAVVLLRGPGYLDDWFEQSDGLSGGLDDFESEVLEQAEQEAAGLTLGAYLAQLLHQAEQLQAIRDPEHGIELATIHGAKGRQWPHVVVVACDDRVLPHSLSIQVSAEDEARGEGLEAERRLAYVAFTRAGEHLELYHDKQRPSPFLAEAGLLRADPLPRARPPRRPPPVPQPPHRDGVLTDRTEPLPAPREAPPRQPMPSPHQPTNPPAVPERFQTVAALIARRHMPRRTTIGRLAADLDLAPGKLATALSALGPVTERTKLRKLDDAQTEYLAGLIGDLH